MKGQKETPRKLPGVLFAFIKKASSLQLPVIKLEPEETTAPSEEESDGAEETTVEPETEAPTEAVPDASTPA